MTSPLKAGSVAVAIISQDKQFMDSLKNMERSVAGWGARVRDTVMTVGLAGQAARTVFHSTIAPIRGLVSEFSNVGNEWHERFWTVLATCKRQGKNVMLFLREAIFSLLHGLSPPSLIKPSGGK